MLECLPRFFPAAKSFHAIRFATALKAAGLAAFLLTALSPTQGQMASRTRTAAARTVVIPASSHAVASDLGVRAHTNVRFIVPEDLSPNEAPPFAGYAYETPASLACLYHVVKPIPGCNPNSTTNTPNGGSQSIAIVDAYDDPNAAADLAFFSAQFGLPFSSSKFQVVYAGGSRPPEDPTGGWEIEESLDIEYSHAMAPNAKLYLVEANSNFDSDLYAAVLMASNLVACGQTTTCPVHSKGRGEVSMSWGGGEFVQETELDSFFTTPGVVYFASAGDSPGVLYPCASPNVVCAGGTSMARNENTGNFIAEIAWSDAGGGISQVEPIPSYQADNHSIARQLGGFRGVPDLSSDSNPNTGIWVWDTFPVDGDETGWFIVGGTSAASPTLAGIVNASGQFASSGVAELFTLYRFDNRGNFNDITYGACGNYSGTFSASGWDLCTGFGSPNLTGR